MTPTKRIFDFALAVFAVGVLAVPGMVIAAVLLICQGALSFTLVKE